MTPEIEPSVRASLLRRRIDLEPTWLAVRGSSMGRTIDSGDRVLVRAAAQPRRGEIWAHVDDDGRLVVHRFRSRLDGRFWFTGDANGDDDRPVPAEQLVGRVEAVQGERGRRRTATVSRLVGRTRLDLRSIARTLRRAIPA
jgi:phage repressor protein C with HTH and peptisase S24 domain